MKRRSKGFKNYVSEVCRVYRTAQQLSYRFTVTEGDSSGIVSCEL
jgi:hypothetical protein